MIPVLGIPVLNRGDLLLRCVRSIDYPVGRLVIVNNGNDAGVAAVIEQLEGEGDFDLRTFKPPCNLGVSASWNWIMRNELEAPYWLLVGNDIQFTVGDLRKINQYVLAHLGWVTLPANWGHSLLAITQAGIEQIGYFDENFYPAYLEDGDHMRRIGLARAEWGDVPDIHAIHGEPPTWGSHTIYADPELFARNQVTHANNLRYYVAKWGGAPGEEKFEHPYNDPALTLKDWKINPELAKANGNGNPLATTPTEKDSRTAFQFGSDGLPRVMWEDGVVMKRCPKCGIVRQGSFFHGKNLTICGICNLSSSQERSRWENSL